MIAVVNLGLRMRISDIPYEKGRFCWHDTTETSIPDAGSVLWMIYPGWGIYPADFLPSKRSFAPSLRHTPLKTNFSFKTQGFFY